MHSNLIPKRLSTTAIVFLIFGCSALPMDRSNWIEASQAIGPSSIRGLRCTGNGWHAETVEVREPMQIHMKIPPTTEAGAALRECGMQNRSFSEHEMAAAAQSTISCIKSKNIPIDEKTVTISVREEIC